MKFDFCMYIEVEVEEEVDGHGVVQDVGVGVRMAACGL